MPADPLAHPAGALREAARPPRAPVEAERVLARARALRRRRAGWTAAAAVLVAAVASLALLAPTDLVRFADGGDGASVEATLTGEEPPPEALADGSPPPAVPGAVAARFPGPVVGTRRDDALAGRPPEPCGSTPLAAAQDEVAARAGRRLDALARAARPVATHVGPGVATTLAVGSSAAAPGYTGLHAAVCIARHDGEGWRSEGLGVDHLYDRWTATTHVDDDRLPAPHAQVTAFEVPAGAAWAVQEQPGWWLAYDVGGDDWMLAHTVARGGEAAFPGARVVFVDGGGAVLADRSTGPFAIPADAPMFRPQTADASLEVGRASQVRARLAGRAPLAVCAEEHGACVWLVSDGDGLAALSAAGPHPLDVPPLGTVAYCPAEDTFQGSTTGSVFDRAGRLLDGPAPSGLHRYEVVEDGGTVLVDLRAFAFGPERDERDARPDAPRCDALREAAR